MRREEEMEARAIVRIAAASYRPTTRRPCSQSRATSARPRHHVQPPPRFTLGQSRPCTAAGASAGEQVARCGRGAGGIGGHAGRGSPARGGRPSRRATRCSAVRAGGGVAWGMRRRWSCAGTNGVRTARGRRRRNTRKAGPAFTSRRGVSSPRHTPGQTRARRPGAARASGRAAGVACVSAVAARIQACSRRGLRRPNDSGKWRRQGEACRGWGRKTAVFTARRLVEDSAALVHSASLDGPSTDCRSSSICRLIHACIHSLRISHKTINALLGLNITTCHNEGIHIGTSRSGTLLMDAGTRRAPAAG
jgi:hypothetical protein